MPFSVLTLGRPTFVELVQTLYLEGYTGPYVVHTLHGNPQMVEFTRERVTVRLDTVRLPVDRREKAA